MGFVIYIEVKTYDNSRTKARKGEIKVNKI